MNKEQFGEFLANLRNEKGLTQEQLADLLNVNYKTVSKWECGNSLPSLEVLTKLSELYNISLYEFSVGYRIKNPLISKNTINRIRNHNTIKKHLFLIITLIIIGIFFLGFTVYSCTYTIKNYNQMKVYELASDNENIEINGMYVEAYDNYYLLISNICHINDFVDETETKSIHYSLIANNILQEEGIYNFSTTNLSNALSMIKLYIPNREIENNINNFILRLNYEDINGKPIEKDIKINLLKRNFNNQLFY